MKKKATTKEQLVDLLTRIVGEAEDMDLCEDGQALLKEARETLNLNSRCAHDMEIRVCVEAGFNIPAGFDAEDDSHYDVTVKFADKVVQSYIIEVSEY